MPYLGTAPASELANLDINGQKLIIDADADTSIIASTDDQIDIEIAGADDFQFTANTFTIKDGSTVANLVVSGDTAAGDAAAIGYTSAEGLILTGQGSTNDVTIKNDADADVLVIPTGTTDITMTGDVFINETADAGITKGMSINQGAADDIIMSFKSSDVAHGMTQQVETDTWMMFRKHQNVEGVAEILGLGESTQALILTGFYTTANTVKSTSAVAAVSASAAAINGTDRASPASNQNLFEVRDGHTGYSKMLVDMEGEIHSDGGAQTAYDELDDVHLIRAGEISRGIGVIDSKFDKFIAYNHEKLAELKLVGREEDGTPNHFINWTGMQRLHNGAIWQQYEKHHNLLNAVYELATKAVGKEEADKILENHDVKLLDNTDLLH